MDNSKLRNTLSMPWFALIVIALAAFVIYSNTFNCPFVFDGIRLIVESQDIRDVSNFLDLKRLPTSRPVVDLTFALNYKFGKLNVFGYHLVNVLIHIANGFMVYFLALVILKLLFRPSGAGDRGQKTEVRGQKKKSKGEKGKVKGRGLKKGVDLYQQSTVNSQQSSIPLMALFAALIFVAHPIQTQAVTYTTQRYTSLAALFYMASVLLYLKARLIAQSSKLKAQSLVSHPLSAFSFQLSALYALSIICGILAFLSKQNTVSLPFAILLVEYLCVDRSWQGWKKKLPWIGLSFILCLIAFLYVSRSFQGGMHARGLLEDVFQITRETELVSRWSYLCTQFNVLVIYIRLLFLPVDQNLDYLYHFKTGFFDGYTPLAFLFLAGLVGLAIWNRNRRPVIALGIFWFFITLSAESSIIPIRDALFEHRLYLPMFGFAIVVSFLLFKHLSKGRSAVIVVSALIIVSLGTATYMRNRIWQDNLTLWNDILSKNPKNIRARNNVGRALAQMGRFEEAAGYFSEVLRVDPGNAKAHYNSGVALAGQGYLDEALRHYSEALRIRPRYAQAHFNSGNAFEAQGNIDQALRHYSEALRIKPDHVKARINLGVVLARKGDLDQAIVHLSKALQTDPESSKAHNNLGGALAGQGHIDEAIRHYTEAVRIRPGYSDAHYNLGVALKHKRDIKGAIRHLSEAVRIRPDHAKAHYDLGNLLASQGNLDEAIRHFSEVVRLSPDNIPVCYNIACAYARQNKREESIAWLKKAVDRGFKRWDLLKTDKDLKNIRETSYYRSIIRD